MSNSPTPQPAHPLEVLLELIRRARSTQSATALRFIAVNDTHLLVPYQQSALWLAGTGVAALSGVVELDANVPYVQWLTGLVAHLPKDAPKVLTKDEVPASVGEEWQEWLPPQALWIPFAGGGVLLARELPWREIDVRLLSEWLETWASLHAAAAKSPARDFMRRVVRLLPSAVTSRPAVLGLLAVLVLFIPVRLSVLAPGELVPVHPVTIRAPFEGIISAVHVETNDAVKAGQPLFSYDESVIASRVDVALEAQRTAEAEQRQYTQQALYDAKARGALAGSRGNVEEKRLEAEFLKGQLLKNKVVAPRDGVVFVDDPSEWVGRPVAAGQRILRIAEPGDKEIEAWLPVGDAIVLPKDAPVRLYLESSPLAPVAGTVRYVAYEASRRPDGRYAYRVRATVGGRTDHRVGLKGTVRLSGGRVPLVYWMLRRPLAVVREFLGR